MEKEIVKLPPPPKPPVRPINNFIKDLKYKCDKENKPLPSVKEAHKEFNALDPLRKSRYLDPYEAEAAKYKKEIEEYNRLLQSKGYAERAEYGAPEIENALVISGLSSEAYSPSKGVCALIGKYIGHSIYNLVDKVKEKEKVTAQMIYERVESDGQFELIKKSKYYKEVKEKLENDKKAKEENKQKRLDLKLKKEEEEKSGKSEEASKKKAAKKKKSN